MKLYPSFIGYTDQLLESNNLFIVNDTNINNISISIDGDYIIIASNNHSVRFYRSILMFKPVYSDVCNTFPNGCINIKVSGQGFINNCFMSPDYMIDSFYLTYGSLLLADNNALHQIKVKLGSLTNKDVILNQLKGYIIGYNSY